MSGAILGWVPPEAGSETRIQEPIVCLENLRTPVGERGGETKEGEAVSDGALSSQLPLFGDQSQFPWASSIK